MRSLTHRRWTLLLSFALVGWLWLSVVHGHAERSHAGPGAHPTCELCAGLDRTAPPPAVGTAAILRLPRTPPAAAPAIAVPQFRPVHDYLSRGPPVA